MEYAIEFNRLVKLEMEGRSGDGRAAAAAARRGRRRAHRISRFTLRRGPRRGARRRASRPGSRPTAERPSRASQALPIEIEPALHAVRRPADRRPRRSSPCRDGRPARPPRGAAGRPEDVAGLAAIAEDRVERRARRPTSGQPASSSTRSAARRATSARAAPARPTSVAARSTTSSPSSTRAGWNQGVVLHVPAGVRLDAPDRRPLGRSASRAARS